MINIFEYLKNNEYPGRGIIVGHKDRQKVIAYFIMGRSENSRNRIFVKEDDVLFTKAYDETKVQDPSLIIYNAIREFRDQTIVTNGDQTDTIYEYLKKGQNIFSALAQRTYEPDAPNFTPRISAVTDDNNCTVAILKKYADKTQRLYYDYEAEEGLAHFISTYDHNGDPLPSFTGEPLAFVISDDFETFAAKLWDALNYDNRISLYVRMGSQEKIFNKHEGD